MSRINPEPNYYSLKAKKRQHEVEKIEENRKIL